MKIKLSNTKTEWADQRLNSKSDEVVMTGNKAIYPAAVSKRYQEELQELVGLMSRDYYREINKSLTEKKSDTSEIKNQDSIIGSANRSLKDLDIKWYRRFNMVARKFTDKFITQLSEYNKTDLKSSIEKLSGGLSLDIPDMPSSMKDVVYASTLENVSLIKSIQSTFHEKIEGLVMRSITKEGQTTATILKGIKDLNVVTNKRAETIAVDQMRKVTTAINVERMKSVGIEEWRWLHSGGGKTKRERHLALNNQTFRYDEPPPIIDTTTGERGYPGQLIHCKCTMVPVIRLSKEA